MSRLFLALVTITSAILICLAESPDEVESLPNQRDDSEAPGTEDIDRSGSAQAKVYASIVRIRPPARDMGNGAPPNFVNCYACVDCPKVLANTTSKYCPYTNDPTKHNKCVVYAEKYIQMKKTWFIRGCASERGSCAEIKRGHDNNPTVKLSSCIECVGDRCNTNGVSRSAVDVTIAIIVLVLCPIIGTYTVT